MRVAHSQKINQAEWATGIIVVLLALIVSMQEFGTTTRLSLYEIFPPLGLIAFSLMWTHFIFGALRRYFAVEKQKHSTYMLVSMSLVLVLILLHPALLWYALFQDGLGLPPTSTFAAYSADKLAIILGAIGLTIFLLYELKRRYEHALRWHYIEKLQIIGMAAVFIHAQQLGGELNATWYSWVWWFYGVTLFTSVLYTWWHNKNTRRSDT